MVYNDPCGHYLRDFRPEIETQVLHAKEEVGFWAVKNFGRDLALKLTEVLRWMVLMYHLIPAHLVHPHTFGENPKNRRQKPVWPSFLGTENTFILVRHVMMPAHG